jgi:HAD superfamily hydrolase (TIGR01509 family)
MTSTTSKAVIFDLDGTLINSEEVAFRVWQEVLAEYGHQFLQKDQVLVVGVQIEQAIHNVRNQFRLPVSFDALVKKLDAKWAILSADGFPLLPGATEMLDLLDQRGIVWGIATNSDHPYAKRFLQIVGLYQRAHAVVGSDEVACAKPAPDVFVECARRVGVAAENCLAVEDTVLGHHAAAAAGMRVVAIPNEWMSSADFDQAIAVLDSLHDLREQLDVLL